jgi:FlaA1/EpsC-like NDP-sugar epimerase
MSAKLAKFIQPTQRKRFAFFFILDVFIVIISLYLAFLLRLDFQLVAPYDNLFLLALPSFLVIKLLSFAYFRLYQLSWRYVSLKDVFSIVKAVILSSFSLAVAIYVFRSSLFFGFPRSIVLIDGALTLVMLFSLRIFKRAFLEVFRGVSQGENGKRTVIIGAGNTGEMILRDIRRNSFGSYIPIAFLDDDINRIGTYLHGVNVVGKVKDLSRLISDANIGAVIIAIPSLSHIRLKEVYRQAHEAGAEEIKIVPRIYDFHRPQVRVHELEDIKIEDLIGRQAVTVDYESIGRNIEGKTVLVTGAAGSIGGEIVNQLCRFNPRQLIMFEIDETELFRMEHQLKRNFPEMLERVKFVVGDVRDKQRVDTVFAKFGPDIVFHAAAYKHVPMMEQNISEAIKVNVIGTYNVAQASVSSEVKRFVLISTDKAVNPTSVMGATKRIAEDVCRSYHKMGGTNFVSVRFGNVLGSRGSVLPLFLEQIQKGESLTVTHEKMLRYFMTIPEAVSLVLQAGVMGKGGDIMVLDMGEPVRIVDFAEELIRLHGLKPYQDVDIKFIGPRPGEKMFEEILMAEEGTTATKHDKIFIANAPVSYEMAEMERMVLRLREDVIMQGIEGKELKQLIKEYVETYSEPASRVPFQALRVPTDIIDQSATRL